MTLKEMCEQVAVYTDRRDDFVTTMIDGKETYDPNDDSGIWFECMKTSINTAYREAARTLLMPDMRAEATLGPDATLELLYMEPGVIQVKNVYDAAGSAAIEYDFVTKYIIKVRGGREGDSVILHYHYAPDPLKELNESPEFPESLVDPRLYISLAAADIWAMERKTAMAQYWQQQYYSILSGIRKDLKSAAKRRIPRPIFR